MANQKTVVGDSDATVCSPSRLSESLRLYMAAKRMSQRDVAKAINCSPSSLTRFIAGKEFDAATTLRLFQWMLETEQ